MAIAGMVVCRSPLMGKAADTRMARLPGVATGASRTAARRGPRRLMLTAIAPGGRLPEKGAPGANQECMPGASRPVRATYSV